MAQQQTSVQYVQTAGLPIDIRLAVEKTSDLEMLKSIAYEGLLSYVVEDRSFYKFTSGSFEKIIFGKEIDSVQIVNNGIVINYTDGSQTTSTGEIVVDTDTCKVYKFNGGDNLGSIEFYAPIVSGNAGQVLVSNGVGTAPEWKTFNALSKASTANKVLVSQTDSLPVWKDVNDLVTHAIDDGTL